MLLETNDGIKCDICSNEFKGKFDYYSFYGNEMIVTGEGNQLIHTPTGLKFDKEICVKCYVNLHDRCKKFIGNQIRNALKCDLCPRFMTGKFSYHSAIFDFINVDVGKEITTSAIKNIMNFNICDKCYIFECK